MTSDPDGPRPLTTLLPDLGGLAVVLALLFVVVGTSGVFSSDEGAALAQADLLADGEGWLLEHPFPSLDPEGERFAFSYAEGGPERLAPFAKHPLYPVVLAPLVRWAGMAGGVALSVVATVLAAGAAAWLAERVLRGSGRPTLWVVGLGSPLLFDAGLVMAHSLGAGFCGLAACGALAWVRGRRPWPMVLAAVATVVAVLLRTEALLFAAGLAGALVAVTWRRRRWPGLVAGGVIAAVGVATFLLERRWVASVLEGGVTVPVAGLARPGLIQGRISGLLWTFVSTTGATSGPVAVLMLVAMLGAFALGLALRRRPVPGEVVTVVTGLTVAAAAVAALWPTPDAVSGVLAVCPFLVVGLLQLRRRDLAEPAVRLLLVATVLTAAGVVVTQYDVGGAAEWGGRFLAIVVPLALAVAVPLVVRRRRELEPSRAAVVTWGLVLATVATSVLSLRALAQMHDRHALLADGLAATVADVGTADDGGPPVVVTTVADLARAAWAQRDDTRMLRVTEDELAEVIADLESVGTSSAIVVVGPGRDVALPQGWVVVEEVPLAPEARGRIAVVART